MSVVTMSYVICDSCGSPGSQPVEGGFNAARSAAPKSWKTTGGDLCPSCLARREDSNRSGLLLSGSWEVKA